MILTALLGFLAAARGQQLQEVATGLKRPVVITTAGDASGRLFIAEQRGLIRIIADGTVLAEPFLDLRSLISSGGERGLLGLAFHPDYQESGFFFVDYTDRAGNTVIARYRVTDNPNIADPSSAAILLQVEQPFANHNGGQLAFGPDGYLYIGLGDGGAGGDPFGAGQDLGKLLGKILRIDVDSLPYRIPPDNPFLGTEGARGEIWAWGLRNPWRFSFDRESGDLFIADVGQDAAEEVDFQTASSSGGENYGWNIMEADLCFEPAGGCRRQGLTPPILSYRHDSLGGRSVTGGFVYRGRRIPALTGAYLFADFVSGRVWAARQSADGVWESDVLWTSSLSISTFGEDEAGELYLADYAAGTIYRVVP